MTKVAIYARYSSDQQRDASIEDQIRLCEERAAKEGLRVAGHYTDHAVSGASLNRPGIRSLIADANAGGFDMVMCEALDRLSRDQEDIAGLYKRMRFAGVAIVTLSEGAISDLHIGLKGTMNALFLKDLADKTRRGLRGRVEAGKSGGGNAYGYDVVRRISESGEAIRGDRTINEAQAQIIRRIFKAYAQGTSPRAIARQLNAENVASPSGARGKKGWGPSTIHGNRQRGTGILNNELYIGRLVWNRLRYIKDPETGKRVSRPNAADEIIINELPDLRIIDQALWDAVKARQGMLECKSEPKTNGKAAPGYWDRRRPRYLFSGLMKCGSCGGGFIALNSSCIGCATARNKGTCDNLLTMRRDTLEQTVLNGLQEELMDPALTALFCDEYTKEMNRLRGEKSASLAGAKAELAKTLREMDRIVDAICGGVPGHQVKDRMTVLENRRIELEEQIAATDEEPMRLHPSMADHYRARIAKLREALAVPARAPEAAEALRGLIERIVLCPATIDGKTLLTIDLHGDLAGILSLGQKARESGKLVAGKRLALDRPGGESTKLVAGGRSDLGRLTESVKLVAGAGFEPTTFRL